ncbi:MAG: AraC family transcriptional regulator [Paludibacter sp.]|nr:AraC family transcriptional regulator [Paludibacter sp.]
MFLKYITLASGFNFLLLAIVTFLKKTPNKKSNNILGIFFFTLFIYCILVSFHYTSLIDKHYSLLRYYSPIDGIFLLMMGPCIYFYVLSVLNKPIIFLEWKILSHLIPFVPYIIFNAYFVTLSYQERLNWLIVDFRDGTLENNLLNVALYTQMIVYLLLSFSLINKQLKVSTKVLTNNILIDISWLRLFVLMNIGFILFSAPLCFYLANERANIIIGQLGMDIQFLYIFFKSVWQTEIFISDEEVVLSTNKDPNLIIDEQLAEDYLKTLLHYMEEFKPHLKEDCNIQAVSERIGISVHHLSNILNQRFEKSFPEFINEQRINEAKRILSSNNLGKVTMEAIGSECGFGSKSSFNKTFKKYTNLTPTEFRQGLKVE